VLQVKPHATPSHDGVLFAVVGQGLHEEPQVATSVFAVQEVPQRWNPALQVNPQATPSHEAVALGGGGEHGLHAVPHESVLRSALHSCPQEWNPVLQDTTQEPLVQAALPLDGVTQALPHLPQF
jgi:hypothetical protein